MNCRTSVSSAEFSSTLWDILLLGGQGGRSELRLTSSNQASFLYLLCSRLSSQWSSPLSGPLSSPLSSRLRSFSVPTVVLFQNKAVRCEVFGRWPRILGRGAAGSYDGAHALPRAGIGHALPAERFARASSWKTRLFCGDASLSSDRRYRFRH